MCGLSNVESFLILMGLRWSKSTTSAEGTSADNRAFKWLVSLELKGYLQFKVPDLLHGVARC